MATRASLLDPSWRYRAGFQATKVLAVTAFSALCAVGAVWWGVDIGRTWGLADADGGVLKPLWQRAAFGGGVALLGLGFFAGMLFYWRFYIVSIDVEPDGTTVRLGRLFPVPAVLVKAADVRVGNKIHTGDIGLVGVFAPLRIGIDAPWQSVYISGWRRPLLLDMRGRRESATPARATK
jgi:hypothetical protein